MKNKETPLEELKRNLQEKPITLDEAKVLLYAIDNELSVKINDILLSDNTVTACHWRCSLKGHGPLPTINAQVIRDQILAPLINPGRNDA